MTGREPMDKEQVQVGYAYLICNPTSGFYKIGSARRPTVRLKQLSTEMRAVCLLVHTIATNAMLRLEREVQGMFIGGHIGGEWFDLTSTDIATICGVSTVLYRDAEWQPRSRLRGDFDAGARWAKQLPICGG